jgi:hypothetical protein
MQKCKVDGKTWNFEANPIQDGPVLPLLHHGILPRPNPDAGTIYYCIDSNQSIWLGIWERNMKLFPNDIAFSALYCYNIFAFLEIAELLGENFEEIRLKELGKVS